MKKRYLSCLLVFLIIFSLFSFSYTSTDSFEIEELPPAENAVALSEVPNNIKSLISDQTADKVFLVSDSGDEAEMFTLRTENSKTGEGTLTMHSVPVKYIDSTGKMKFIDTSMKPITTVESAKSGFIYRNSANSFSVEFSNTASRGINFNNAFTFEADSDNAGSRSGEAQIEKGAGKITYPSVFGSGTRVEYINTENGIKENIILDKYTGQNRFVFIFRSDTHVPTLTENGMNILVADKNDPKKIEYRFLSLYAYDSYDPANKAERRDSDFRHLNEDLFYELTDNDDGAYTITVVVPEDYLTHPETVYPVTIDPSVTLVSNNSNAQDTFVSAATPNTQNNSGLDYIRFGKVNGYKNFGYHRFTLLPTIPTGANITSAYLKFTFRSGQTTPTASSGISMWTLQVTNHQWYESTITWNNQPYGSPGPITPITYNGSYLDYFYANITNMVQAWYSGSPNYGIDFTYSNEDHNDYNSVVSSEGESVRAPALTITYTTYGETSGITSGQTYFIKNVYSGKYLDAEQSLNSNVIQYNYHGNSNQQWRVVYQGSGLYKLYNHYSFYSNSRYCLDLVGLSDNNIDLWYDSSSDYVLFNILSNGDGTYRIQNYWPRSNAVLTVANASSPSNVYNSSWNADSKQKWVFETRTSKAVTTHSGTLTVGMSADNYGSSSSNITCAYGFRVSTHTANGFWSGLSPNLNIDLSFYNFNYGSSHSYTWATKNDFLSKHNYSISSPNIDNVNFMLFVGHGLGKNLHFSHGPAGTNHSNDINSHSAADLNFSLSEANFGYGNAVTKWVLLYTCNFINESSLANVRTMMKGCNIVMGYDGQSYLNEPQGTQIGTNLRVGKTIINSFFSTGNLHMQYGGFATIARAVYINDAYGDTINTHLQYAGTHITEDVRMTYSSWS
jgi:hypothetical protein